MARPERKTVDYFPHYISDGKKMFYIEQKYGNDGYATWFKILESLASTDDHFINLNSEMDLMFLSAKCRISIEVLINILNDLSLLGEIDHFLWLNKIVYSRKFIESIQDAYTRRNNKCMNYDSFCIHYSSLCTTITLQNYKKSYNNTQSKVKYTKVNETKENNSKENENEISLNFTKSEKLILFDSWWNLYNKKTGKEKTQSKWITLSFEEMNKCLDVVSDYVKSTIDKQFRKNPLTYLNGKHWEDEIIFKTQQNGTITDNRTEQQKLADAVNHTRERRKSIVENGFFGVQ